MAPEQPIFDPNGDVILVLNRCSQTGASSMAASHTTGTEPTSDELPSDPVKMLVSSKHMALASPCFAKMLKPDYKEGSTLHSEGRVEIGLPDDDLEALTILLNIIHGLTKRVPRRLDLKQLLKIAIMVDKYEMHEAVSLASEIWLDAMGGSIPTDVTEDTIPWLCISWVFGDGIAFQKITEVLMRTSDAELDEDTVNELPIPEKVMNRIQYERRQGVISTLIREIHELLADYSTLEISCKRNDGKKSACDAMVLGSLLSCTQKARLFPFPEPPYQGYTVESLKRDISSAQIETLCDVIEPVHSLGVHNGENSPTGFVKRGKKGVRQTHYDDISSVGWISQDDESHDFTASRKVKDYIKARIDSLFEGLPVLKIEDFK